MHPQLSWILRTQLLLTLLAALLALALSSLHAALSSALGGLLAFFGAYAYFWRAILAPGLFRAKRVEEHAGLSAKTALQAQAAGERWKFLLTLLCFALTFKIYAQLSVLPFFLTYALASSVYWFALLKVR